MQIHLRPEIESELNRISIASGRPPEEVIQDLLAHALANEAWFREQVAHGIAALDQGQFVAHEDVVQRLEHLLEK